MRILSFDIGGTAIKSQVFDESAHPMSERIRVLTPRPATPKAVLGVIESIAARQPSYDRVAAGFPGVVKSGVTLTAANLDRSWVGYSLQRALETRLGAEARVANDADVQGLGASRGKGLELMITLGTGVGSALIYEGELVPNLELGHHPYKNHETYEDQLGKRAFARIGKKRWNQRVRKVIPLLLATFNYDTLFIGGGNAKHIDVKLPENTSLVSNESGLLGCVRLWFPSTRIPARQIRLAA